MPEINYIAVVASAITFMIIGAIWYGPLFGKLWMQGLGWNTKNKEFIEQQKKSASTSYLQMFIGALLTSYILAHIIWAFTKVMGLDSNFESSIRAAVWIWLGFILPVKYSEKLWAGKKLKYISIDLGYYLIATIVAAIIITYWK